MDGLTQNEKIKAFLLTHFPQRVVTRLIYWLTRIRWPWFKNTFIRVFIKQFNVDMSEAQAQNPEDFATFNHFFTRALQDSARPLATESDAVLCPVDGAVSQCGAISGDSIFQAKGHDFSLAELLGGNAERTNPFKSGTFATLYLSPRDYHRIHMPLSGRLIEMIHVPGKLHSVSPLTTKVVPALFARNERVVCVFEGESGPFAMVLVGAVNVASIETVWAGVVTPPLGRKITETFYPDAHEQPVMLKAGDEMGRFNMGSTVIVVFPENSVELTAEVLADAKVRMGELLGRKSSN